MPELKKFFSFIAARDTKSLILLFSGKAILDDPLFDSSSAKGLEAWIALLIDFYHDRVLPEDTVVFRAVKDGNRHVVEVVLQIKGGVDWDGVNHKAIDANRIALPVALVGEFHEKGGYYTGLRIYFGTWGLLRGEPRVRLARVTNPDPQSVETGFNRVKPVKKYFDWLREGDVEKTLSTFEQDGYFREPADAYVVFLESNSRWELLNFVSITPCF